MLYSIFLMHSLILSHLNYGILVWGQQSSRLFTLQKKKAVRCVSKVNYCAHISPLYKTLATLKLEHLFTVHEFAFYYKFENYGSHVRT